MSPYAPKPKGEITITVSVYSDVKDIDIELVQQALDAELDGMELEVDCDDADDGVAVVQLSTS